MEDEKTIEINQETQPIAYAQQTRADRLREASSAPDFTMPAIRPVDDFFSESVMEMDDYMLKDIMRQTGITESTSEQVSTAISNALIGMNQLKDETKIAYGNLANYFTGGKIGDEIAQVAYESITQRYNEMANAEEAIGGIRSELAKLAGGAASFTQLALEGMATFGVLPLAHIGIQEFGQGTYNDMKAYADKHDGSLKGYEPEGFDLAANFANSLLQVGIESWLGVGSPRFLQGASRGLWVEGLSGALQEGVQGALSDLTEAVKGNEDISILLDNAEDYLRDAIIGGFLQGSLGAVTHHQNYARAVNNTAKAIAKAHGHEEPTAQENQTAKAIIDAKERQESSILTQEFKSAFDASTGEGQLQAKIASALKKAAETKELDLDTANETEMAQRIEQIATQETLNAMDYAREQNRAISDMELNNIVYKDGAIWLEGLTPEVGDKAVSYARVLAERQSGLAELKTRIDANTREIQQLKADLAEAKAQKQESRAQVLQARIDKQNAIAEKNRLQAQKLEAQTAKLEKQIAKQTEQVKVAEPVETEKVAIETKPVEAPKVETPKREVLAQVKKKEPVAERKSLKKQRVEKKSGEKKRPKTWPEKERDIAEVYERISAQMAEVNKRTLAEQVTPQEKEQAEKTGQYKHKGDVYVSLMPQIDDITKRFVLKWHTFARENREKTVYATFGGEFTDGSTGWGKYEIFDTKEDMQKVIDQIINEFGEDYAYFDMQFTDDSLKSIASGHQQEKPEALNYKNKELRDLEQQGFEEQYEILHGIKYSERKTNEAFAKYERDKAETELARQDEFRKSEEEDWAGKTPSEVGTQKIADVFETYKKAIAEFEKDGVITDKTAEGLGYAIDEEIGKEVINKKLIDYIFMKYDFDPRVEEWIKENPDLLRNNYDQKTSWNMSSESNLVDVIGEDMDFPPENLIREGEGTEKDEEGDEIYDYTQSVYKMPSTQEEFEAKIAEAMIKQTKTALEIEDGNIDTYELRKNETPYLFQGSITGKGDTARGGYDEELKRIVLNEKSDLSTIQHEFAHYWIQNNFKWARSGLASQDWLRRWRDVEEWLGIEPQDRLLSKSASEKFAKAYERYILEGKVAPELQWAFEGFQKAYQDIYDDLEKEYFDLEEELAPEVIDWFNRNKEQSPKRLLQADEKKLEKALTLDAGGSVIEEAPENTIVMTEQNKEGDPVVYMGVKQSEVPAGDNLLVQADKTTASKLQRSAKNILSDKVEVQQLATLDTQATLKNFKDWIARDRQGAWNAMMNPDTRPIYKTYLYKAFSEQAMNDVNLAMELANIDIAESVRELGQAIQALNIRNESGFDMIEIIRNLEKSKGELSEEELNNSIAESGVFDVELSEEEMNEIDSETECKL